MFSQHFLVDELIERFQPEFIGVGLLLLLQKAKQEPINFRAQDELIAYNGYNLIQHSVIGKRLGLGRRHAQQQE